MIKPEGLVKLTPWYILISLLFIPVSVILKIFDKAYTDFLIYFVYPFLISGTLFQIYPTIQGERLKLEKLTYLHFSLFLLLSILFLFTGKLYAVSYLFVNLLFAFIILVNTKRLEDLNTLFLLVGSLYLPFASLFLLFEGNGLFVKHLINVGFILNVVFGAYYIFVPMLQIEELNPKKVAWVSFFTLNLSIPLFGVSWFSMNFKAIALSGTLILISVLFLSLVIYKTLSQRKSPMKGLDISVQLLILGLIFLVGATLIGVYMAKRESFSLLSLHSDAMLYGFLVLITLGATYHIIPFLVWWERFAPRMGKEKIPTLKEILPPSVLENTAIAYTAALLLYFTGVFETVFLSIMAFAVFVYVLYLFRAYFLK
ncbi:hypothetical protein [Aquifex sp.]